MQKAVLFTAIIILASSAVMAAELSLASVEIVRGQMQQISVENAPYGGVYGSIKLKLGFLEWYTETLWMLPEGSAAENFDYTGSSYTVPSSMNMTNNCRTSVYYNSSIGYAFKTSVKANGTFCMLADPGKYAFIAEY